MQLINTVLGDLLISHPGDVLKNSPPLLVSVVCAVLFAIQAVNPRVLYVGWACSRFPITHPSHIPKFRCTPQLGFQQGRFGSPLWDVQVNRGPF